MSVAIFIYCQGRKASRQAGEEGTEEVLILIDNNLRGVKLNSGTNSWANKTRTPHRHHHLSVPGVRCRMPV